MWQSSLGKDSCIPRITTWIHPASLSAHRFHAYEPSPSPFFFPSLVIKHSEIIGGSHTFFFTISGGYLIIPAFWFGSIIISRPFAFMLMFTVHPILCGWQSLWSFDFLRVCLGQKTVGCVNFFCFLRYRFSISHFSLMFMVLCASAVSSSVCLLLGRLFDHFLLFTARYVLDQSSSAWARSLESTPASNSQLFPLYKST